MKLGTLSLAYSALEQLFETNLPVRVSFSLHKIMETVRQELNYLETMRVRLLEKHTDNGVVDRGEFLADYNELLESESDIDLPSIALNDIIHSDAKISPMSLHILFRIGVITED